MPSTMVTRSYKPGSSNVFHCNCIESTVNALARGKYFASVDAWIDTLTWLEIYPCSRNIILEVDITRDNKLDRI